MADLWNFWGKLSSTTEEVICSITMLGFHDQIVPDIEDGLKTKTNQVWRSIIDIFFYNAF